VNPRCDAGYARDARFLTTTASFVVRVRSCHSAVLRSRAPPFDNRSARRSHTDRRPLSTADSTGRRNRSVKSCSRSRNALNAATWMTEGYASPAIRDRFLNALDAGTERFPPSSHATSHTAAIRCRGWHAARSVFRLEALTVPQRAACCCGIRNRNSNRTGCTGPLRQLSPIALLSGSTLQRAASACCGTSGRCCRTTS